MKYNRFKNGSFNKGINNKTLLIIVVAVVALVAIVGSILLISKSIENQKKEEAQNEIIALVMNILPQKTTYYVGEEFDPTGAKIQVITADSSGIYFVDAEKVSFSGFDSSAPVEEQVITVTYQGFTTTFTVTIKEFSSGKPTLVSIEVCDLIDSYTVEKWNKNGANLYGAYLKLTYSDGSTKGSYEETPLLWDYVEPLSKVDKAGTTTMTINYIEGGIVVSTTVSITITE